MKIKISNVRFLLKNNKNMQRSSFFEISAISIQILIILIGECMSDITVADNQISDQQIIRIAKIAKATGTDIRVVKEITTVTVYGSHKKTNKKVKKTVMSFFKSASHKPQNKQKNKWVKLTDVTPQSSRLVNHPPILEEESKALISPILPMTNNGDIAIY